MDRRGPPGATEGGGLSERRQITGRQGGVAVATKNKRKASRTPAKGSAAMCGGGDESGTKTPGGARTLRRTCNSPLTPPRQLLFVGCFCPQARQRAFLAEKKGIHREISGVLDAGGGLRRRPSPAGPDGGGRGQGGPSHRRQISGRHRDRRAADRGGPHTDDNLAEGAGGRRGPLGAAGGHRGPPGAAAGRWGPQWAAAVCRGPPRTAVVLTPATK